MATANKEKGNAAFKAGKYAEAIGHYTAAALADPSDPTFFLNRAAAYLKLSKNEDAERDCTTVLGLSKTNVKALYRRAQARVALQKLGDAHNDLQRALKLEPNNEAVKTELVRVDELILNGKKANKTKVIVAQQRSVPVEVSTPLASASSLSSSSSTTAHPKRRRIPITIVDDDTPESQSRPTPSTSTNAPRPTNNDFLNPISSRVLSPSTSTPTDEAPAPVPITQKPTPASSFKEAKQTRDAKSVGRVGGGIFRMSGNDTVVKTREVPAPAPVIPLAPTPVRAPVLTPTLAAAAAPLTLFEFTRAWDRIPAADTTARWALLNTVHPTSLPTLFGASLEPMLLASLFPVLAAAAPPEQREATESRDTVRAFMCALTRVPRFKTVVLFLSRTEWSAARAVWEAIARGEGDAGVGDIEEAARVWGFADA